MTRTKRQFIETVNFLTERLKNIPGSYTITVKRINSCLIEEFKRNLNMKMFVNRKFFRVTYVVVNALK